MIGDRMDNTNEVGEESYDSWNSKGDSYREEGKHQEAIECYDNAIKYNPNSNIPWRNKGLSLFWLGREDPSKLEEAIKCFDNAIERHPCDYMAWVYRGLSFKAQDKTKEFSECFEKAKEINSEADADTTQKDFDEKKYLDIMENFGIAMSCFNRNKKQV
jgi:tetratricopeptide (TPR) repeat protein